MSSEFDIFKFLDDYQRFPCLWLKNHPDFKVRYKREAAEEVLLESSGLGTIENLRRKIRSIRYLLRSLNNLEVYCPQVLHQIVFKI